MIVSHDKERIRLSVFGVTTLGRMFDSNFARLHSAIWGLKLNACALLNPVKVVGWMLNMFQVTVRDSKSGGTKRATSEKHATSAPAELGGKIHNISRNRSRTHVLPQVRKSQVYASGTVGAFWYVT